jgi:integrase/recombinase XerD
MVKKGKGNRDRNIPIHTKLNKVLNKYLEHKRCDKGTNNFFSSKSGKVSAQYIRKELKKAVEQSRIKKKVTPHIFRHSFIITWYTEMLIYYVYRN